MSTTHACRHLVNGTESENGTDRETDELIAASHYLPTVGRGVTRSLAMARDHATCSQFKDSKHRIAVRLQL